MGGGGWRVEWDRAGKLSLGPVPMPVVDKEAPGKRRMGRGNGLIELQCLMRVFLGAPVRLVNGNRAVIDVERVGIREPRVGGRVAGILRDGLLEVADRFRDAFLGAFVPRIPAFEIEAVGLYVLGVAPRDVRGHIG